MKWKLTLITIAVFLGACTDNAANGKTAADASLKALEAHLTQQVLNQPAFRDALEENKAKWIRVAPGSKAWCMALTKEVFDQGYVRCMNGYEAEVEKLSNGQVRILQLEDRTTR